MLGNGFYATLVIFFFFFNLTSVVTVFYCFCFGGSLFDFILWALFIIFMCNVPLGPCLMLGGGFVVCRYVVFFCFLGDPVLIIVYVSCRAS